MGACVYGRKGAECIGVCACVWVWLFPPCWPRLSIKQNDTNCPYTHTPTYPNTCGEAQDRVRTKFQARVGVRVKVRGRPGLGLGLGLGSGSSFFLAVGRVRVKAGVKNRLRPVTE